MEETIKLLNSAFEKYNLDNRENLSDKILEYIADRLLINKIYINYLIEVLGVNITFDVIWNTFEEARAEEEYYKKSQEFRKFSSNYFMGIYATSKGNIAIETDDLLHIIKYFVIAIKTRNTITISKINYNEISIESILLVIFCEALNKFGLDRNLLMILPFEECYYEYFDEVIVEENEKLNIQRKEVTNKYVIYLEDEKFKENVKQEIELLKEHELHYEIVQDEFYKAIDKINKIKPIGAAIYTSNTMQGYKFINLIHSNNVFVNASLINSEDFSKNHNSYYLKKKIIYPMINYDVDEIPNQTTNFEEKSENTINSEFALTVQKANPWYNKIFEAIKKFFKK